MKPTDCTWSAAITAASLCIVAFLCYIAIKKPRFIFYHPSVRLHIIMVIIALSIGTYYGLPFVHSGFTLPENMDDVYKYSQYIIRGSILILILLMFTNTFQKQMLEYVFIILLFLLLLMLVWRTFRSVIRTLLNIHGIVGAITRFVFYIPCLLNDLLQYALIDIFSTKTITYLLILAEIVFFLVYWNFERLTGVVNSDNALFIGPVILAYNTVVLKDLSKYHLLSDRARRNFAVSMWIILNEDYHHPMKKHIFTYGAYSGDLNSQNKAHPRILFKGNNQYQIANIGLGSNDIEQYDFQLTSQVWHNIVVQYNDHTMDLFVDGELLLAKAIDLQNYLASSTDQIFVGDMDIQKSPLSGAICQIQYHPQILTAAQIRSQYLLSKYKNPPTSDL